MGHSVYEYIIRVFSTYLRSNAAEKRALAATATTEEERKSLRREYRKNGSLLNL